MVTFSKIGSFGRLGNQLFQIAAAYGLGMKNSIESKFYKWEYSDFFKNPINQELSPDEIFYTYSEPSFHYKQIPYVKGIDLVGYFQSEKYFIDYKEDIKKIFEFKDEIFSEEDERLSNNYCSIHVRRTDYLNLSNYHPFPGIGYYIKSMDYMRNLGINKFIFFSDDIEWCKENFGFRDSIEYSEKNSNIKDLALMTKCSHNIIANSSFSWWGAWLNNNPEKIVVAPSVWFGPEKKGIITDDLYCNQWIKI